MGISLSALNIRVKQLRFRVVVGIVLSVLIHLIVLFGFVKHIDDKRETSANAVKSPIEVTLLAPPKPTVTPPKTVAAPAAKAAPPVEKPKTKPAPAPTPKKSAPAVKSTTKSSALKIPSTIPMPNQSQDTSNDMDMSQMLNQARERRQQAAAESAQSQPSAPSANDIAKANIDFEMNRNKDGKNGIFAIINKGPRIATYAFFGWDKDRRDARRQIITVDAGLNGDVDLAIINSMITLIRKYYTGNFNWDSQRLGRVIVLSARPQDTKELQTFLRQEMFSGR